MLSSISGAGRASVGRHFLAVVLAAGLSASCKPQAGGVASVSASRDGARDAMLRDDSNGNDWPGYGRTYGEQHFSPLTDVNDGNVAQLGLAWSLDITAPGVPTTVPVAADGILYYATGLSVVQAVDAASGKVLWTYNPDVGVKAGLRMRATWGIRGLSYWDGKVYVGTMDGRLLAIDARSGEPVWSVDTTSGNDLLNVSGAPRIFDGKVIIGHGGADSSDTRSYVTTYDARTGKQLWRFFVVPGDPAKGFEDSAQAMAAKTWTGEWWKHGGGGAAWNAFTYDAETGTILVGTGNGTPWNAKIRSPAGGDNLFLCSIVALDANTGAYKWHYQVNPAESWDYNATMDMQLADLVIDGKLRKVVMQAPKNGFFYVIDRTNGKLISAEKFAKATWASRIDLATGRPVENPAARYPNGQDFEMWPSPSGAHGWMPMAFSPQTRLAYIPRVNAGVIFNDRGVDLKNWQRPSYGAVDTSANMSFAGVNDPLQFTSDLVAWNPVTQQQAWSVRTIGGWSGGVLATAGNLVFQGQLDGKFSAYSADSGKEIWSFDAKAPIVAAPITYRAQGVQYVSLVVGIGTSPASRRERQRGITVDYRTQQKRVLTFRLGGHAQLPPRPLRQEVPDDPSYKPDPAMEARGKIAFGEIWNCGDCHGPNALSAGAAPDLRRSMMPQSAEAFAGIVRGGNFLPNGMPQFPNISDADLEVIRQYLRGRADQLRTLERSGGHE